MRKLFLASIAGTTLMLGGCAAGYGTGGAGILGSILGGSGYGNQGNSQFERAAVDACGREASRYGRVRISDVRQNSRDTIQVYGEVESRDRRSRFYCTFRSDGRVVDFRLD